MGRMPLIVTAVATAIAGAGVHAQDANLGRSLVATCANCHGTNGMSQDPMPTIAGMDRDTLVRAMKEYKAGTRTGTIMPQLAKGYTDAQIETMAAWLAAQKPPR